MAPSKPAPYTQQRSTTPRRLRDRAAELFDALGKAEPASGERERATADREGAAADRERAPLRIRRD